MPRGYFSSEDHTEVAAAIAAAEAQSSGEIRIYIESNCLRDDPVERALEVFSQLGMERTQARNGVLLYIAMEDRKLAIYGDMGIHEIVHQEYWNAISADILRHFGAGAYVKGICECVHRIGQVLKDHFPARADDTNELPDDIVFGQ